MKKFFITVIIFVLAISVFNYCTDPFDVFHDRKKSYSASYQYKRFYIVPRIKLKNKNDIAVFGASAADIATDEEYLYKKFKKPFLNFALPCCTYEELFLLIKKAVDYKRMVVFISYEQTFNMFPSDLPLINDSNNLTFNEIIFLLFSKETLISSLMFISESIKPLDYTFIVPKYRYEFGKHHFMEKNMQYVEDIKNLAEKNKSDLTFATCPLNVYALCDIYLSGCYDELENFKRKLVEVTPYYDFLYLSKYNSEPISLKNPYYSIVLHYNKYLNAILLEKILTDKGDFGIWVTPQNIDRVLEKQKKDLIKFIADNKKQVDEYMSYERNDHTLLKKKINEEEE